MNYRMPWRSIEPLKSQWDGSLYEFVDYALEKIEEAWKWDDPGHAAKMIAALTPEQLALWAITNANGQVCNGGFLQFFYNSYGELAEEAIQGFHLFGMKEYAGLFEQVYAAFHTRPIPKNRGERNGLLADIADEIDPEGKEIVDDPDVPEDMQIYTGLAKTVGKQWDSLTTQYYKLIDREGVPGGYNAAFFRPLADFIEAHPDAFFLPKSA